MSNVSQRQDRSAARAESSRRCLTWPEGLVNLRRIQPTELAGSERHSFVAGAVAASPAWDGAEAGVVVRIGCEVGGAG